MPTSNRECVRASISSGPLYTISIGSLQPSISRMICTWHTVELRRAASYLCHAMSLHCMALTTSSTAAAPHVFHREPADGKAWCNTASTICVMALHRMTMTAAAGPGVFHRVPADERAWQTLMLVKVLFSRMLPPALIRMPLDRCPFCTLHAHEQHQQPNYSRHHTLNSCCLCLCGRRFRASVNM